MAVDEINSPWAIVIDTDKYAGNFEREMCAFCTGCTGECGVGEETSAMFYADLCIDEDDYDNPLRFDNIISQQPDDHGCCRPVSITPGPDGKYNSLAIFFEEKPSAEQIGVIRQRAGEFAKSKPEGRMGQFSQFPGQIRSMKLVELKREYIETEIPI